MPRVVYVSLQLLGKSVYQDGADEVLHKVAVKRCCFARALLYGTAFRLDLSPTTRPLTSFPSFTQLVRQNPPD